MIWRAYGTGKSEDFENLGRTRTDGWMNGRTNERSLNGDWSYETLHGHA